MPNLRLYQALTIVILLFAPALRAQTPSTFCSASAGTPALLRAEGVAELVSDVVLTCSGGTGTVGPVNVTLYVGYTNVTSRIVAPATSGSEALLLVDDLSGGASQGFNLYQGSIISGNGVVFSGVTFNAPGSGTRTLRITNLRVDASQLVQTPGAAPPEVLGFVSISGTPPVPIQTPEMTLGVAVPGMDFSLRRASDGVVVSGISFNQSAGESGSVNYRLSFRQAFAHSFKSRNIGTTSQNPAGLADQTGFPGTAYNTESGYYSPNLLPSANGLNVAGLATQGTRLITRFTNIPAGASLYVTLRRLPACCTDTGQNFGGEARLLATTAADGAGAYNEAAKTGSALLSGTPVDIAPVVISGGLGQGQAVWEVLANPDVADLDWEFGLVVVYGAPLTGIATVNGGMGPGSASGVADASSPVPRFSSIPSVPSNSCASNPCLSVSPRAIMLNYQTGATTFPSASISATSTSGSMQLSTAVSSQYDWLSVSGGLFTPAPITVNVDPSKLPPGVYSGTVTITGATAINGPQVALVILTVTAGSGPPPMSCFGSAAVPPLVRAEGVNELTGDFVLNCTGGVPGQLLQSTIQVFLAADITNRILNSSTKATDALLLVDEPSQWTGTPLTPGVTVFQGILTGVRAITFFNVPIVTPASGATRILRITNIRINATQVPAAPVGPPGQIQAMVFTSFYVMNPVQVVAVTQPGTTFSLTDTADVAVPTGVSFNQAGGSNVPLAGSATATGGTLNYLLRFTEGFATAYKLRKSPDVIDQNTPGAIYNTESGFFSSSLPSVVLADTGTRLMARFSQIPDGVKLYVTTTLIPRSQAPQAAARLIAADANGAGPYFEVVPTSTVNVNGTAIGIAPVDISAGTGSATWEVTGVNNLSADQYVFGLLVAYAAPVAGQSSPAGVLAPLATTATAHTTAPVPRFYSSTAGIVGIFAGDRQSARIGAVFGTPLQVRVTDTLGNPITGATISFAAPALGPSGSFAGGITTAATNALGIATAPAFTANTSTGSYQVIASVPGSSVAFTLTNTGLTISGIVTASGTGLGGVSMALGGGQTGSTTTDANGNYSFADLPAGNYTITPSKGSYTFNPPSRTLSSISNDATAGFTALAAPILSIYSAHAGAFTQGQTGATYSITVSNAAGGGPTSGAVTVTDTVPAGFTLVSMGGSGWSCSANNCTRSDVLAGGASYPPITVAVSVSASAPAQVTNVVSVSGGGSATATATDVTVILPQSAGSNLSVGKSATQSSTVAGYPTAAASSAMDGNSNGNFAAGSVTHTNQQNNPWWQADLGSSATVNAVVVWNRTDCCSERLSDYWVFVSDTPFASSDAPAALQSRAGTWSSHQTSTPAPAAVIVVPGVQGRYVRIQLSTAGMLSLAEVQVTGTWVAPAGTNIALGKPAGQSSTVAGYPTAAASSAVDANTSGSFAAGTVTHTNLGTNAWWEVDLGGTATIQSIVIWNRTDCCVERLSDYWVFVSNTPFGATDTPATLQTRTGTWSSHQTSVPSPMSAIAAGGVQGRYVRVQLAGTGYLSLAEVQIIGTAGSPAPVASNVAQGKAASQSSTVAGYPTAAATSAVDGNTSGSFAAGTVTHTNLATNAWWEVDLGGAATIQSIVIWNRMDCCVDRLSDYWVFVSSTPFGAGDTPATLQTRAGTWSSHQTSAPSPSTAIVAGGAQGRYVRVQLAGTNYLSLAEVQVIGTMTAAPAPGTNMAEGRAASQSSTPAGYPSADASSAVDGNTNGNFAAGTVTHTNLDVNAWWQVDLGAPATVSSIMIWNRADCCSSRLSDYWVFVSNTPFGPSDTPATLQSRAGTWASHQISAPNPSTTIPVPSAQGRYVRVQLSGADYLALAEVQVMGL